MRNKKFTKQTLPTYIETIDFSFKYRFAAGRKLPIPVFKVKNCEVLKKKNNADYSYISIAKWGWEKAWEKAMKTASFSDKSENILNFISCPPLESDFI